jgi:hypothetical protein
MTPRFCVYQYQHLPLPELRRRWRLAEELGFDVLWNVDTVVDPDRARSPMFDGPATLAAMAMETNRIRIGTLVTSLYFRQPVLAARTAASRHMVSGCSRSPPSSGTVGARGAAPTSSQRPTSTIEHGNARSTSIDCAMSRAAIHRRSATPACASRR